MNAKTLIAGLLIHLMSGSINEVKAQDAVEIKLGKLPAHIEVYAQVSQPEKVTDIKPVFRSSARNGKFAHGPKLFSRYQKVAKPARKIQFKKVDDTTLIREVQASSL